MLQSDYGMVLISCLAIEMMGPRRRRPGKGVIDAGNGCVHQQPPRLGRLEMGSSMDAAAAAPGRSCDSPLVCRNRMRARPAPGEIGQELQFISPMSELRSAEVGRPGFSGLRAASETRHRRWCPSRVFWVGSSMRDLLRGPGLKPGAGMGWRHGSTSGMSPAAGG